MTANWWGSWGWEGERVTCASAKVQKEKWNDKLMH